MVASLRALLSAAQSIAQIAADPHIAALWIGDEKSRHPLNEIDLAIPSDDRPQAIRRLAIASLLELDPVDQAIDLTIADKNTAPIALEGLLRAGVDWDHPSLKIYATDPDLSPLAAPHLAIADPDTFAQLLDQTQDEHLLFTLLRQAALSGDPSYFSLIREWMDALHDELTPSKSDALNAHLALLDPIKYARLLIAQELSSDWLRDDRLLADFLTINGPSDWIEPLAVFRTVRDLEAFELTAAFAISAALTPSFDDIDDQSLDPAGAARWIEKEPSRVALQLAIGGEDELAEILVATTLHQTLLERGITPPAIAGLPLSGFADTIDPAPLLAPLVDDDSPQGRLRMLRSLADLRRLNMTNPIPAPQLQKALATAQEHPSDQIRQYIDAFDDHDAFSSHTDWGCRGLYHAHRQLRRPPHLALQELTRGLFDAPLERVPLYRLAIEAILSAHES